VILIPDLSGDGGRGGLGARGEDELEGVDELVAEEVPHDGEERDAVDEARTQAALDLRTSKRAAPVADAHLPAAR
jgi:hypothetical protein